MYAQMWVPHMVSGPCKSCANIGVLPVLPSTLLHEGDLKGSSLRCKAQMSPPAWGTCKTGLSILDVTVGKLRWPRAGTRDGTEESSVVFGRDTGSPIPGPVPSQRVQGNIFPLKNPASQQLP